MDNRTKIIDCALELFAARGYDAVSVQEIVDAVEIGKPTLYHYFGSKQGLLEAVLERDFAPLNQAIQEASTYTGDVTMSLRRVVQTGFQFASQHPVFYRLQLAMWFAPPDCALFTAVAPHQARQFQTIETLFLQAASDHGNMRGRHSDYATAFLGMLNNTIAFALNGYIQLSDELMVQIVHQFMHGIFS